MDGRRSPRTETLDRGPVLDLAIIGAGPVGLEAAAAASEAGLEVVVLERETVGRHVLAWGHVRMFTEFGRNVGPAGRRALGDAALPDPEAALTGAEFHAACLRPLADALGERVEIREGARVTDVTRDGLLKGDAIGDPGRDRTPFRVLIERAGGEEIVRARSVIDASGTFGSPNRAGPGGAPALGERACAGRIRYAPPDVLGDERDAFAGARTLLIGGGHSAATTAVAVAELARQTPGTSLVWLTRSADATPLAPIDDDPLPRRSALVARANRVALDGSSCDWRRSAALVSVEVSGEGLVAEWTDRDGCGAGRFDRIVANVGYEPDERLYRQLQVHECYATRGPMKLSAALLAAAGEGPADCLVATGMDADTLANPEPGFFILGMKSYGKNGAFLLERGYDQVAAVVDVLLPIRAT